MGPGYAYGALMQSRDPGLDPLGVGVQNVKLMCSVHNILSIAAVCRWHVQLERDTVESVGTHLEALPQCYSVADLHPHEVASVSSFLLVMLHFMHMFMHLKLGTTVKQVLGSMYMHASMIVV